MINNYRIDIADREQSGLQLIDGRGKYNTWRVYFDSEVVPGSERVIKTLVPADIPSPEEMENMTEEEQAAIMESTTGEEKEVEVTIASYSSKFIEVRKPKTENVTALGIVKEAVLEEINAYDQGNGVNSFLLNGVEVWLDKSTRVGLMNSTTIQKESGQETATLWLGNKSYVAECDLIIELLGKLELYAIACFNKTAEHKSNISALDTIEGVTGYDYTAGYPEKLNITLIQQ